MQKKMSEEKEEEIDRTRETGQYIVYCADEKERRKKLFSQRFLSGDYLHEYLRTVESNPESLEEDLTFLVGVYFRKGSSAFRKCDHESGNPMTQRLSELMTKYVIAEGAQRLTFDIEIRELIGVLPLHIARCLQKSRARPPGIRNKLPRCLAFNGGLQLIPETEEWEPLIALWQMWKGSVERLGNGDLALIEEYVNLHYRSPSYIDREAAMAALSVQPITSAKVLWILAKVVRQFAGNTSDSSAQQIHSHVETLFPSYSEEILAFYAKHTEIERKRSTDRLAATIADRSSRTPTVMGQTVRRSLRSRTKSATPSIPERPPRSILSRKATGPRRKSPPPTILGESQPGPSTASQSQGVEPTDYKKSAKGRKVRISTVTSSISGRPVTVFSGSSASLDTALPGSSEHLTAGLPGSSEHLTVALPGSSERVATSLCSSSEATLSGSFEPPHTDLGEFDLSSTEIGGSELLFTGLPVGFQLKSTDLPRDFELPSTEWPGDLELSSAQFPGSSEISSTQLPGSSEYRSPDFRGDLELSSAQFPASSEISSTQLPGSSEHRFPDFRGKFLETYTGEDATQSEDRLGRGDYSGSREGEMYVEPPPDSSTDCLNLPASGSQRISSEQAGNEPQDTDADDSENVEIFRRRASFLSSSTTGGDSCAASCGSPCYLDDISTPSSPPPEVEMRRLLDAVDLDGLAPITEDLLQHRRQQDKEGSSPSTQSGPGKTGAIPKQAARKKVDETAPRSRHQRRQGHVDSKATPSGNTSTPDIIFYRITKKTDQISSVKGLDATKDPHLPKRVQVTRSRTRIRVSKNKA